MSCFLLGDLDFDLDLRGNLDLERDLFFLVPDLSLRVCDVDLDLDLLFLEHDPAFHLGDLDLDLFFLDPDLDLLDFFLDNDFDLDLLFLFIPGDLDFLPFDRDLVFDLTLLLGDDLELSFDQLLELSLEGDLLLDLLFFPLGGDSSLDLLLDLGDLGAEDLGVIAALHIFLMTILYYNFLNIFSPFFIFI